MARRIGSVGRVTVSDRKSAVPSGTPLVERYRGRITFRLPAADVRSIQSMTVSVPVLNTKEIRIPSTFGRLYEPPTTCGGRGTRPPNHYGRPSTWSPGRGNYNPVELLGAVDPSASAGPGGQRQLQRSLQRGHPQVRQLHGGWRHVVEAAPSVRPRRPDRLLVHRIRGPFLGSLLLGRVRSAGRRSRQGGL